MKRNQYSDPFKIVPPTVRQKQQRTLAWSLRILLGAEASIKHFVPDFIAHKHYTLVHLKSMIRNVRDHLANIS